MDEFMPGVFNILPVEKKQVFPAASICHFCWQTLCTINFPQEWIAQIYMESLPWFEEETLGVTAISTEVYFLLSSFRTRTTLIISIQQVWSCSQITNLIPVEVLGADWVQSEKYESSFRTYNNCISMWRWTPWL